MKSIRIRIPVWFLTVCLGILLLAPAVSPPAAAWFGKGVKANGHKPFSQKQAKAFANKLVHNLSKRMFFRKADLPRRVTLALIPVQVMHREVTDQQFTDFVANALLNDDMVSLVNQEPQFNEGLAFKLMSYDGDWLTRRRGLLLGANYVITGGVEETTVTDDKGHVYRSYSGRLQVRDISTNRLLVEQKAELERRKIASD